MKIVVLGAGRFGANLVRALTQASYSVRAGVREPSRPDLQALARETGARVLGLEEAFTAPSVGREPTEPAPGLAFVALPWPAALEVVGKLAPRLGGWTLVDCTNPIDRAGFVVEPGTSAAEELARAAPQARVVKAFNTLGSELLTEPLVGGQKAHVLMAADDAGARTAVEGVVRALGFLPQPAGPLENARLIEAVALLWIRMSFQENLGPRAALRVLR